MASRYWVGGTATWNATAGTKWATASAGAGGAAVPTATDDVFFDGIATGGGAAGNITVTVGAASVCNNIDFTGFAGTFAGSSTLAISAAMTLATTIVSWTYTGAITFNDTSGTVRAVTSHNVALLSAITFDGVGGSWQLADALSTTGAVTFTNGTLDTNGKAVQSLTFASNNTNTRTFTLTNTTWTITGTGIAWNMQNFAGLAFNVSGSRIVFNNASGTAKSLSGATTFNDFEFGGSGVGSFTFNSATTFRDVFITNTGAATVTQNAQFTCRDYNFTGFTGTWATAAATQHITGSLTIDGAMTNSNTTVISFEDTSGATNTITSNGVPFIGQINFSGVGGVWQLADDLASTSIINVLNGAFSTNGKALNCKSITSSNSNVRTIDISNSIVTLTGTGVVWNVSTSTNLTLTVTGSTIIMNNASSVAKSFTGNGLTYGDLKIQGSGTGSFATDAGNTFRDLTVSASGGAGLALGGNSIYRNIDFTGYNGTLTGISAITVSGNLTFSATMTNGTSQSYVFNGSTGTQTITSHGISFTNTVAIDTSGSTVVLADAMVTTNVWSLKTGTFDTQGFALTATKITLAPVGFGTRTLFLRGSTVTLTSSGTIWIDSVTTLTFDAGTSTIVMNDATSSDKSFGAVGGLTYYAVQCTGAGTGAFIFNCSTATTFDTVTMDTPPHTMEIGGTMIVRRFVAQGTAGNLQTIQGKNPGVQAVLSKPWGDAVDMDYCSVTDMKFTGGARWFMGRHSVDAANTNGARWCDYSPRSASGDTPYAA